MGGNWFLTQPNNGKNVLHILVVEHILYLIRLNLISFLEQLMHQILL